MAHLDQNTMFPGPLLKAEHLEHRTGILLYFRGNVKTHFEAPALSRVSSWPYAY